MALICARVNLRPGNGETMPFFEYARILPCPPAAAWDAITDFPGRVIHGARYHRAALPDGDAPAPGHRIELQIGRDRFTSVVTACQRPDYLSHRTAGPGFWTEYSYYLRMCREGDAGYSSEDLGRAYLTIRAEYGGWLGKLVARLRPGACRRYLADEMTAVAYIAGSIRAEPADDD